MKLKTKIIATVLTLSIALATFIGVALNDSKQAHAAVDEADTPFLIEIKYMVSPMDMGSSRHNWKYLSAGIFWKQEHIWDSFDIHRDKNTGNLHSNRFIEDIQITDEYFLITANVNTGFDTLRNMFDSEFKLLTDKTQFDVGLHIVDYQDFIYEFGLNYSNLVLVTTSIYIRIIETPPVLVEIKFTGGYVSDLYKTAYLSFWWLDIGKASGYNFDIENIEASSFESITTTSNSITLKFYSTCLKLAEIVSEQFTETDSELVQISLSVEYPFSVYTWADNGTTGHEVTVKLAPLETGTINPPTDKPIVPDGKVLIEVKYSGSRITNLTDEQKFNYIRLSLDIRFGTATTTKTKMYRFYSTMPAGVVSSATLELSVLDYIIPHNDYFILGLYVDYNKYLVTTFDEEFSLTNRDEMYSHIGFTTSFTETATTTTNITHNQSGVQTHLRILAIGTPPEEMPDENTDEQGKDNETDEKTDEVVILDGKVLIEVKFTGTNVTNLSDEHKFDYFYLRLNLRFGNNVTHYYTEQDLIANANEIAYVISHKDYFILGLYVDNNSYLAENFNKEFKQVNKDEMYAELVVYAWVNQSAMPVIVFATIQNNVEAHIRVVPTDTNDKPKVSTLQITFAVLGGLMILGVGAYAVKSLMPKKKRR